MAVDKNIIRSNENNALTIEYKEDCDPLSENGCHEMLVNAWSSIGVAEYQGSRAQLESEGVIPVGFVWPRLAESRYWQVGNLNFSLNRCRPPGLKGPMKLWTTGDWWQFRWTPEGKYKNWGAKRINQKSAELAREIYLQSRQGIEEQNLWASRYFAACSDKQFQVFKDLIPSLQNKKSVKRVRAKNVAVLINDIHLTNQQGVN